MVTMQRVLVYITRRKSNCYSYLRFSNYTLNNVETLGNRLISGHRDALAKSITLIESTRQDHREYAVKLLDYLSTIRHKTSPSDKFYNGQTLRIGIAGPPGAGKSTFIEKFGLQLINQNKRVSVIPVDPSSHLSGGSILGDKTRMELLSRSDLAYIRASPTRGVLGGIAEHTSDIISLCESANYDVVIIESVGLGQSEVEIEMAVDMLLYLIPPGSGDSLQASKKGIMEAADMIVVNKADGDLYNLAQHTKADYAGTMQFIRRKYINWKVPVVMISSIKETGLLEVEEHIRTFHALMTDNGTLAHNRLKQSTHWMWNQLRKRIVDDIKSSNLLKIQAEMLIKQISQGKMTSRKAAQELFNVYKTNEKASAAVKVH